MVNNFNPKSKRSQVSIFIIIAIVIAAVIILYLVFRGNIWWRTLPRQVQPVYDYFSTCIEDETKIATSIMGSQAGYIELPEFEPGSDYMPFSSQLDFMGMGVPYWYYVSRNGIAKEQIPSKNKMEEQLSSYLKERIDECSFKDYREEGFEIEKGDIEVDAKIEERKIIVNVNMPLTVSFENSTGRKTEHKVEVSSKLGRFYDIASTIYKKEQETEFLEGYGVDVLRLYAPVDGSDLGCSPKIWYKNNIREDLMSALQANVPAIKVKGDYYALGKEENKYFVQDIGEEVDEQVNFIYSRSWPMKLDVWPEESGLLMAEPVGLQEGMGMLGFCYVPYHFVYDFAYPVLIQVYDGQEVFQFPVSIVIDKNMPRQALDVEGLPDVAPELCEHKLTKMSVYTYDSQSEPVEARIKYKCFDTTCYIGDTLIQGGEAVLTDNFPQCANGYVIAESEGYKISKYIKSTIEGGEVNIFLDKKYKLDLETRKDGKILGEEYAIIIFTGEDYSTTVVYPEQKEVELIEGDYEIKVFVYSNSTINLEGSTREECIDVPKSGISGIFGGTDEKCFTMEIPDQIVSFAVSGGGTQQYYVTESELQEGKLTIDVQDFGKPEKVEDLQLNYNNIETGGLDVYFG
jgi:hypothetical protein